MSKYNLSLKDAFASSFNSYGIKFSDKRVLYLTCSNGTDIPVRGAIFSSLKEMYARYGTDIFSSEEFPVIESRLKMFITKEKTISIKILNESSLLKKTNNGNLNRDTALSAIAKEEVFRVKGGILVLKQDDWGVLFESESDFSAAYADPDRFANVNAGNIFPHKFGSSLTKADVDSSIEELETFFRLKKGLLTKDSTGLLKLDKVVNQYYLDSFFIGKIERAIALYVGSVLSIQFNGNLISRQIDGQYYPVVSTSSGEDIHYITFLWESLYEHTSTGGFSSIAVAEGILAGYRIGK